MAWYVGTEFVQIAKQQKTEMTLFLAILTQDGVRDSVIKSIIFALQGL